MINQDELVKSFIEVRLKTGKDGTPNFNICVETLQRIGIASKFERKLYQSVHLLHKFKGRYFLVHFKQLFQLDQKPTDFTDNDRARLNQIANLLASWDLVELIDPEKSKSPIVPTSQIKILSYKEKKEDGWELCSKYSIGFKKR